MKQSYEKNTEQNNKPEQKSFRDNQNSLQVHLPVVKMGRPTASETLLLRQQTQQFCDAIKEVNSRLNFRVSARGWCYLLEEYGLNKGDFDKAENLINDCRKSGDLPLNICAEDEKRVAENTHFYNSDGTDFESWANDKVLSIKYRIDNVVSDETEDVSSDYFPFDPMDFQNNYVELMVEKVDLIGIFKPVCQKYSVAFHNRGGWADLNSRAAIMKRFEAWEQQGKQCVLLYCGDHDPGGLHISDFIRSNFADLSKAVGWSPDNLIIDRFGLDYDFIEANHLTWIDNLRTAKKKVPNDLSDPRHNDHNKPYVQTYLKKYGVHKCEANALLTRMKAGEKLCEDAILKYINTDGIDEYRRQTAELCQQAEDIILRQLSEDGYIDEH